MRVSRSQRNDGFHRRIGLASLFLFVSLLQLALPGNSASAQLTYTLPWMNGSVWRIVRDEGGHGSYSYDAVYVRGGDALVSPVAPGIVRGVQNDVPNDWVYNGPYGGHAGNCVIIEHPDGNWSLYAHLLQGSIKVHEGQEVGPGTELGRMGWSGVVIPKSTGGSHLHWEVGQRSRMYNDTYRTCTTDNTKQMRYSDNDAELREDGGIPRPGRYYESTGGIALNCDPRPLRVVYYDKPITSANAGYELSTGFVVKNINPDACGVYTAQLIGMAARGPGGEADIQDFPLAHQIEVLSGFTYRYDGSRSFQTPGAHVAWPVAQDQNGAWYALLSEDGQSLAVSFEIIGLPQEAEPSPAIPEQADPDPDTPLPAEPDGMDVPTTVPENDAPSVDTPPATFAPGQIVQVAGQGISLRSEPDESATIIAEIPMGELITILYGPYSGGGGWYVALSDRSVGWISPAALAESGAMAVPGTPGHAGTSSSASGSGQQSSASTTSGSSSGTANGQATTYGSTTMPVTQEVHANTSLLLRAEPGKGLISITPDNSIGQVVGDPVVLNGTVWYRVDFGKWGTGWVAVIYLEIRTAAAPAAAASPSSVTAAAVSTTTPAVGIPEIAEPTPPAPVVIMPVESPTATAESAGVTSPTETPVPPVVTFQENPTATELPQSDIGPETHRAFAAGQPVTVSSDANMYQEADPASLLFSVLPMGMGGIISAGPVEFGGTNWYQVDADVYGTGWIDGALLQAATTMAPPESTAVVEEPPTPAAGAAMAESDGSASSTGEAALVSTPESEIVSIAPVESPVDSHVSVESPDSSESPTPLGAEIAEAIPTEEAIPVPTESDIFGFPPTDESSTTTGAEIFSAVPTQTPEAVPTASNLIGFPPTDESSTTAGAEIFSEIPTEAPVSIAPSEGSQIIESSAPVGADAPVVDFAPTADPFAPVTTGEGVMDQPQADDQPFVEGEPVQNEEPAANAAPPSGPLESVKVGLSLGSPEQAALVDGNPATAWYLPDTLGVAEGYFTIDLGEVQHVSWVKWQEAPEGFWGSMNLQTSIDNEHWDEFPLDFSMTESPWTTFQFDREVRYVRFVFHNDAEASLPQLGGLAEIEVWP